MNSALPLARLPVGSVPPEPTGTPFPAETFRQSSGTGAGKPDINLDLRIRQLELGNPAERWFGMSLGSLLICAAVAGFIGWALAVQL